MKQLSITTLSFLQVLALILILNSNISAQAKDYKITAVAFYNLENLFDTEDDPEIKDEEFTPGGSKSWTEELYQEKIANMAYVLSKVGADKVEEGPAIIGLSELENKKVLEDLVAHKYLSKRNYGIVHHQSPDFRGIDVAFLYQKDKFTPTDTSIFTLEIISNGEKRATRDILMMSGNLEDEKMHFIVNHWPSRRGGTAKTSKYRQAGAKICRTVVDSLLQLDPNAKVMIMGDLNDNPTDKSVITNLMAKSETRDTKSDDIYNPMINMFNNGAGSNAYRDTWSLFDQIMFTGSYLDKEQEGYFYYKTMVFNKSFLIEKKGRYKGYPKRTFSGSKYNGGYSDHFPVFVYLLKAL